MALSEEALDALAEMYRDAGHGEKPPPPKTPKLNQFGDPEDEFCPRLNPVQGELYASIARYILAYGERGSGKTIGGIHKLVRHCRNNLNALGVIITGVKRQAEEGGAWHKLNQMVLPEWKAGCGMEYTDPKTNTAKDVFIWVENIFGSWSRILLLSMPVEGFVADRFKGPEPSFILVDEAQTLDSDTYFKTIVQQIGRRHGIKLQQVVYCCNPAGPSHWLYKRFFVNPVDPETGKVDDRYAVFHIPIVENIDNLPAGYYENVLEAVRGDDTEYRRMVLGEWVDAPTGEALFRDDFSSDLHVRGDAGKRIGIQPVRGVPVVMGWDLGSAHSSVHMMQLLVSTASMAWIVFDEFNYVDQYVSYNRLVPVIIERMVYWDKSRSTQFQWEHISDDSAFNQFRAHNGSFDYQEIEKLSKEYVAKHKLSERYIIRMRAAPKGAHSVEARVRGLKEHFLEEKILISATCSKTLESINNLEMDEGNRLKPKRSRFLHPFDSMTYPIHYYNARVSKPRQAKVEINRVYSAP